MELSSKKPDEKIKLLEINSYLTCYLCKGYLIDATTISECLHSFCRSCIIKFIQDNSYCPVCEMIINKAKPNLKLDKTLQDIVYKLVPELFLREMTRRKLFYQQYPQIAVRVTPEERGEDTERTIFNPQDFISLSMEYVSDDSAPDAIRLPEVKNGSTNKPLTPEENQALMKRYLQCPGMCRVDVLKKFVRNKYNVDTNLFYIDILYKKVPLPDYYTLIDIAYIYSWKRNEPMKFFFRITDLNKVNETFDIFNSNNVLELVVKPPVRTYRTNGDKPRTYRRRESSSRGRKSGKASRRNCMEKSEVLNKIKCEESCGESSADDRIRVDDLTNKVSDDSKDAFDINASDKTFADNIKLEDNELENKNSVLNEIFAKCDDDRPSNSSNYISGKDSKYPTSSECKTSSEIDQKSLENHCSIDSKPAKSTNNDQENKENKNQLGTFMKTNNVSNDSENEIVSSTETKPDISTPIKAENQNVTDAPNMNPVYTNITLRRTNNVEIITKIQKVSNQEGQPIGLNIIKQTVKKTNSSKLGGNTSRASTKPASTSKIDRKQDGKFVASLNGSSKTNPLKDVEEEKRLFLESFELKAKVTDQSETPKVIEKEPIKRAAAQKRKNPSPVKNDRSKKPKLDKKPTKRIIIQYKPKPNSPATATASQASSSLQSSGLQTLIENCKIPSSLSITIKEISDTNKTPLLPPVKNYIEILKLPDENVTSPGNAKDANGTVAKLEFPLKLCDNDSEQKVDQDLAEIARSLTEKIPMSTTISQIVGPKQQFPIPTKSSVPSKSNVLPSPVPELSSKLLNIPKDASKLTPRSPQTFQKIFEESIKKPDGTAKSTEKDSQKTALDLTNEGVPSGNNSKRNILEIASQLYKKTKLELEKNSTEISAQTPPAGKVPIPRLPQKHLKPQQKNLKFEIADSMKYPQTVTSLHSNALGMNYTVSVGPNASAVTKVNGTVTNIGKEISAEPSPKSSTGVTTVGDAFTVPKELPSASPRPSPIPRNLSPCLGYNSPRNSPKHSPKSSPVIKHMYAPTPNLLVDPLRVNTFTQKIPSPKLGDISKQASPGRLSNPSPNKSLHSPNPTRPTLSPSLSPKPSTPVPAPGSTPTPQESTPGGSNATGSAMKASPTAANQMTPSQILEKYNIQNLAQLTASLNFNAAAANFGLNPGTQFAALQHAMLLKHFEMQNRQNWMNMNQGPLLQYEKYIQNLKGNQNHLLGNIKEN